MTSEQVKPPPQGQRPRGGHSRRRAEGEGSRNSTVRALSPLPTSFPPFASFPSFQRYSKGIPAWLQLKHHQPAFLRARDTEKKTRHPGPLPGPYSAGARQRVRGRPRESVLRHPTPLAPFSSPGHCRQSAEMGLRSMERIQKSASPSTRQVPSGPPSPLSWTLGREKWEGSQGAPPPPQNTAGSPLKPASSPSTRWLLFLSAALLKICQDDALKEIKPNSLQN